MPGAAEPPGAATMPTGELNSAAVPSPSARPAAAPRPPPAAVDTKPVMAAAVGEAASARVGLTEGEGVREACAVGTTLGAETRTRTRCPPPASLT